MNAFEQIVAGIFRGKGYWTINGYRVDLSKDEKVEIGTHSMPRPELDILAYQGSSNELIWVECKSYLDSPGVRYESFINPDSTGYNRYKVFNYPKYREVITQALQKQTTVKGLTRPNPTVKYCLVAGNSYSKEEAKLTAALFEKNGWLFYNEDWIAKELEEFAHFAYEDDVTMIVAKLIHRNAQRGKTR